MKKNARLPSLDGSYLAELQKIVSNKKHFMGDIGQRWPMILKQFVALRKDKPSARGVCWGRLAAYLLSC